jgi:hypothetical protein
MVALSLFMRKELATTTTRFLGAAETRLAISGQGTGQEQIEMGIALSVKPGKKFLSIVW